MNLDLPKTGYSLIYEKIIGIFLLIINGGPSNVDTEDLEQIQIIKIPPISTENPNSHSFTPTPRFSSCSHGLDAACMS